MTKQYEFKPVFVEEGSVIINLYASLGIPEERAEPIMEIIDDLTEEDGDFTDLLESVMNACAPKSFEEALFIGILLGQSVDVSGDGIDYSEN